MTTPDLSFQDCDYTEADPTVPTATAVARAWAAEKHFTELADRARSEKNRLLPRWRDQLLEQGITDAVRVRVYGTVGVSAKPTVKTRASAKADAVESGEYARVMREHGLGDLLRETTHHGRLSSWVAEMADNRVTIPEEVLKVISVHTEQTLQLRKVAVKPEKEDEDVGEVEAGPLS